MELHNNLVNINDWPPIREKKWFLGFLTEAIIDSANKQKQEHNFQGTEANFQSHEVGSNF